MAAPGRCNLGRGDASDQCPCPWPFPPSENSCVTLITPGHWTPRSGWELGAATGQDLLADDRTAHGAARSAIPGADRPPARGILATLLVTGAAAVLLVTPTAYHRILFRLGDKEHLLMVANRLTLAGLG